MGYETRFRNVLLVEKGADNARAQRSGAPFSTITAALAAAVSGDVVHVMPGTYDESITIGAGVSVVGASRESVIISQSDPTLATNMVTLGNGSAIEGVTVRMAPTATVTVRGIVATAAGAAENARVRDVRVEIDQTGVPAAGGSLAVGVYATSVAVAANNSKWLCENVDVYVLGRGTNAAGVKRGILVDTAAASVRVRNSSFTVERNNAGASYIGAEINIAGGTLELSACVCQGFTADVSQTAGTLLLSDGTRLASDPPSANGLGFTTSVSSNEQFCDAGVPTAGAVRFLRPGTGVSSKDEIFVPAGGAKVARYIAADAITAPGGGNSAIFTLQQNGKDTAVTVTLSGADKTESFATKSVGYKDGDTYSVECDNSAGSKLADVRVTIGWG